MFAAELETSLAAALADGGPLLFLTGAGVSAESGIPTFRGPEGYWRVGAREYRPEALATHASFQTMPAVVWGWYLYRRGVCRRAGPNPAHLALASLERQLGERFALLTQNVDGLHLRAGNSPERTLQVHGNLHFARCTRECGGAPHPLPESLDTAWTRERLPAAAELAALACPRCGAAGRPHVLWFDECYDEERYRAESALALAERASLLVVIGTSGATNLPLQVAHVAARRGVPMLVFDPEPNPFAQLAARSGRGWFVPGKAGTLVPALAAALGAGNGVEAD